MLAQFYYIGHNFQLFLFNGTVHHIGAIGKLKNLINDYFQVQSHGIFRWHLLHEIVM